MSDHSLVPVDYQPDFENVSLVPVDYNPFGADGVMQQAQGQQPQPAQPEPQGQPPQPVPGVDRPGINGPAPGNDPGASSDGAVGGNAGSDPNKPTSDQTGSSEPPFGGFANPTPTESLINQVKMNDQRKMIKADPAGEHGFVHDEEPYAFVTTKKSIAHYLTPDHMGQVFTEISPFYARQGSRFAIIDASPERPVTVTAGPGTFTMSRP
jgi:hypothetical protein